MFTDLDGYGISLIILMWEWLGGLCLTQDYSKLFAKEGIDGSVLLTMTKEDLKSIGITTFGDLRKIEQGIKEQLESEQDSDNENIEIERQSVNWL